MVEYPFGRGLNLQIIIKDLESLYRRVIHGQCPVKLPLEEKWYRVENELLGVGSSSLHQTDFYSDLVRILTGSQSNLGILFHFRYMSMKSILITGANRLDGLGFSIASLLAKKGHKVFITARTLDAGAEAVQNLGVHAKCIPLELTKSESIRQLPS